MWRGIDNWIKHIRRKYTFHLIINSLGTGGRVGQKHALWYRAKQKGTATSVLVCSATFSFLLKSWEPPIHYEVRLHSRIIKKSVSQPLCAMPNRFFFSLDVLNLTNISFKQVTLFSVPSLPFFSTWKEPAWFGKGRRNYFDGVIAVGDTNQNAKVKVFYALKCSMTTVTTDAMNEE